jgi:hypothetical protein
VPCALGGGGGGGGGAPALSHDKEQGTEVYSRGSTLSSPARAAP